MSVADDELMNRIEKNEKWHVEEELIVIRNKLNNVDVYRTSLK